MAEGFANQWLENNQVEGWEVTSAGTLSGTGYQTSQETVLALRDHGVVYEGESKSLTKELVDRATVVLCMTSTHCIDVASVADDPSKVEMLNPGGDMIDPVGRDQSVYDELARTMLELIPKRMLEISHRPETTEE